MDEATGVPLSETGLMYEDYDRPEMLKQVDVARHCAPFFASAR